MKSFLMWPIVSLVFVLCGYPKARGQSQPATTSAIAKRQVSDPTEVYYSSPFDAPGVCRISQIPHRGWIEDASEPHDKLSPGEIINSFESVNYKCMADYFIEGPTTNVCFQGEWRNPIPDCQPTCSTKAISGVSIVAIGCFLNDVEVSCSDSARPGTFVHMNCQDRYERQSGAKLQIVKCGAGGVWTPLPDVCTPICGEEAPEGTPYIVGGFHTSINEVPWHVGIYKWFANGYTFLCGGTIINARVVISAMHCFWDASEGKPFNVSLYRVAAGKEKIGYDAIENQNVQKFAVERIFYEPGYNHGTSNYAANIVLVILKMSIEFKSYITPICIPYGLTFAESIVPAGWKGRIAGWGLTVSGGSPSEILKLVELPVIDKAQCISESDIGYRPFITPDKFCAGYLDSNASACQGDSGGGLVFPKIENNRKKWYLRGVSSDGPNKMESCDSDKYTTFTNIAYFENLISTYETRYRPR